MTMLLVVVIHSALAYCLLEIPNLIWVMRDPASEGVFDLICWWALGISSPFFLLSGFFAVHTYQTRGARQFLLSRFKRIVVPFLVAAILILPMTLYLWSFGWLITGRCTLREILRLKFLGPGLQANLFGPAHLWTLEYLIVILLTFWLVLELRRWLLPGSWSARLSGSGWAFRASGLLTSPWRPLLLAVPTALVLWMGHEYNGLDAMMDRRNSFVPEPFRLLHNGVFFVVGVGLYHQRQDLSRLKSACWSYLALSIPVFACRAWLIHLDLSQTLTGSAALALAFSGALFSWLVTFGMLGLAQTYVGPPRRAIRYLAESSYWIYLTHLPIVGLIQITLSRIPAPGALKFLTVLTLTLLLCLSSYQVLVRYSFIGSWLHGRHARPQRLDRGPEPLEPISTPPHRLSTPHPITRGLAGLRRRSAGPNRPTHW